MRDKTSGQQTFTAHDRDVLFTVDGIRDRAVVDRSAERPFPEDPPVVGVECAELLVEIAPEHQIASGREHGAVPGRATFVDVADFSRRGGDFCQPAQLLLHLTSAEANFTAVYHEDTRIHEDHEAL